MIPKKKVIYLKILLRIGKNLMMLLLMKTTIWVKINMEMSGMEK